MNRRRFLSLAAGSTAAGMTVRTTMAHAANWPERSVKIVVPFAAGSATDMLARPWADWLTKVFNQQFVLEHRGGASGLIGAEAAFRAQPDGYTFLFSSNSTVVFQPLLRTLKFDPRKFVAVARVGDAMSGFCVNPKHGFKKLQDMIDYAKANPGKLNFGSFGPGTTTHLRIEMLKFKTGTDILHVPYGAGQESLPDLLSGVIDIMNEGSTLPHVKAGKLTLLNINHFERFAEFPDVPTLTECGVKDADVPVWLSLYAPPGTPAEIAEKLNAAVNEISRQPETRAKLQTVAAVPVVQTLADMQKHWEAEYVTIAALIKQANIKIE